MVNKKINSIAGVQDAHKLIIKNKYGVISVSEVSDIMPVNKFLVKDFKDCHLDMDDLEIAQLVQDLDGAGLQVNFSMPLRVGMFCRYMSTNTVVALKVEVVSSKFTQGDATAQIASDNKCNPQYSINGSLLPATV
jgi:hypothetical protein